MVRKKSKKRIILQIVVGFLAIVFIVLSIVAYQFIKPKTDESIYKEFEEENHQPFISKISYKEHTIRVISMQEILDTTLPILIFVHGSPGSGMNFKNYLADAELNKNANLITYDRVGYSVDKNEKVLNGLEMELEVLQQIISDVNRENIVLIGYSYGGTIVAAASENYKSKILLAPAIKGEYEPTFWMLNLTKWKVTSAFVPNVLKNAAQEKFSHLNELPAFENKWIQSSASVTSIHGLKDRVVPYENSLFLLQKFSNNNFKLITIPEGNHGLVWNKYDLIKNEILKEIKK